MTECLSDEWLKFVNLRHPVTQSRYNVHVLVIDKAKIKIGSIELNGCVYIPPMAGVTDIVYRKLCREFDPDVLLSTEMLSSKSLTYAHKNSKTHRHTARMDIPEDDPLTGIQLFGHEPEVMAEAAKIAEESGAKFIDINMGCPVPKIVKGQDGAALLREPDLACDIVRAVIAATKLPVTVKTRLGWCAQTMQTPELAKRFEDLGVKAMTIHGRTRSQLYSGEANWEEIAKVVSAIKIPVFANGDIKNLEDAKNVLKVTGAAGMAIARATMGKPWFSKQVNHYIRTGEILSEPNVQERLTLALKHCQMLVEYKGPEIGIRESRRHIVSYTAGMKGAAKIRPQILAINSVAEAEKLIDELLVLNS